MNLFLLNTSTLTITRYSEGTYTEFDGWQPGASTTFDIQCNIQPFQDGRSRTILPDGVETNGALIVYSKTRLNPTDQITRIDGDEFDFDGFRYRVVKLENWNLYGLQVDHYKHIAVRQDLPSNGGL